MTNGRMSRETPYAIRPGVAAIVTHYNRPRLVNEAIGSLLGQTQLPDAIVVLDDASESFALGTIISHPLISVYRSTEHVGPYRLIDWAMRNIPFEWYMIQDSDDISAPTRLGRLLAAASKSCADLVGSAILNVNVMTGESTTRVLMHDAVSACLRGTPYVCTWGSSLLSRRLWVRVGGLATGLRFSADAEFFSRACYAGQVINIDSVELVRRLYPDSLTQRQDTGMGSPARKALRLQLHAAANARIAAHAAGMPVDLRPFSTAPEIRMDLIRQGSPHNSPPRG